VFCRPAVFGVFLSLFSCACVRSPRRPVERLAIPPFENLSSDPSHDWVGRALSEAVAAQIAGSAKIHPLRLAGARNASMSGATAILRGYFTVANGRVRLNASREDLDSRRVVATFQAEDGMGDGILRIADSLARWIEPRPLPFETGKIEALKALVEGRASEGPAAAVAAFERSVTADQDFGSAYVAWAQLLFARGDRDGARHVVDKARGREGRLSEMARAELDLIAASLDDDSAGRRRALAARARLTPADADLFRQLGREETAAHRYDAAAEWYRRVTSLDPLSGLAWNQLGYAQALRRNLEGARAALLEYARLAPKEANPLDSLGDVCFYLGAFQEAEKSYLQAQERDGSFLAGAELYKAARARLMTGDIPGADQIFRRYVEGRKAAQDPLADYRQAQWLHMTGRRGEALALMRRLVASSGVPAEAVSLASSQLAAWSLAGGAREEARDWAGRAAAAARSPSTRSLAALCRLVAEPPARPGVPQSGLEKLALAYVLLQEKRFAEAVPVLSELAAATDPMSAEQVDFLLAWALTESGRTSEASPYLETYGIPQPGIEPVFGYLTFPRVFLLKSTVLEKQGRSREAGVMREIYKKLAGLTGAP
jgi:tetratricopeptide (TPR) repeat protein/TolB-like protein